jgi:hypothetical protein
MNASRRQYAVARPWFLWLTDTVSISPHWVGLALSAVLMGAFFAIPMPPRPGEFEVLGPQIMVSFIALSGILIAAMPRMEAAALRDLAALRTEICESEAEFRELERSITHFPARTLWLLMLLAPIVHVLISAIARGGSSLYVGSYSLFPIVFWLVFAPATYVLLAHASLFGRAGRDLSNIHLFDHRALRPFSRVGLRTALFYSAIFATTLIAHTDWSSGWIPTYAVWLVFILWTPIGLALALLPMLGVHRRIRAEKSDELERIRAAMDGIPNAFEASSMAALATELRGIALLDYREKVEAVREWPFDASGLRQLTLYLLIPPLGWLGGALVERVLDRALQ